MKHSSDKGQKTHYHATKNGKKLEGKEFIPTEKDEWSKVVKKSSKRSASSFFSKRNHPMCKIALINERLTKLLVKRHSMITVVRFPPPDG